MKLSQTKAKREISLHHCFRGRFKTRFFLPIFPSIFLKNHEMENSYNFLTILLPHVLCAREWEKKKDRSSSKSYIKEKLSKTDCVCCSKFQFKINIYPWKITPRTICRTILQRWEREKRSVFDFHPRETQECYKTNALNYSPFTIMTSRNTVHISILYCCVRSFDRKNKLY